MPRNASSVYTLPGGNPVIPGTTITSSWANTTLQDIATALTQSLSTDGSTATVNLANKTLNNVTLGTLTSPLSIPNGGTGGATAVAARANLNASRIIAGTANQIVVTNADGVAGAPTLSIASPATFPGALTTTGNITAMPGGFISGSTNTTIANDGTAGNILLRPNGVASTVGQVSISAGGAINAAGQITYNTNLVSSGANTVIGNGANDSTGTIILRPQGIADSDGEVTIGNAGALTTKNSITFLNNLISSGVQAALSVGASTGSGGSIYLRPNGATDVTGQLSVGASGAVIASGSGSFAGSVVSSGIFASSTAALTLTMSTGLSGTISLRPNGLSDTTGQTTISPSGNMAVGGALTTTGAIASGSSVTSSANFISSTTSVGLCTTGAGIVVLRPNGAGSTTGQVTIDSAGVLTTNSFMTVGGGINFATNLAGTGTNVVIGNGQTGGTGNILLRPKGVADGGGQVTIDNAGVLTLGAGQILFPATANPSVGANVLDDYEEGTFTPTITFGGASTGWTFSSLTGAYVKVGRHVWIQITINVSAKGSATGVCQLDGLPFSNTVQGQAPVYASGYAAFAGLTPPIHGTISATSLPLFHCSATAQTALTDAHFTSTSVVRLAAQYGAT